MLLNLLSPIPVTFIMSSIELKYPFSSLYFIIFSAVLLPIPVRVESFSIFAVLILTILLSPSSSLSSRITFLGTTIFSSSLTILAKFSLVKSASIVSPPANFIAS